MAYTPTTWSDGDVITAEKLNKLEQGVKNEQVGPAGPAGPAGPSYTLPAANKTTLGGVKQMALIADLSTETATDLKKQNQCDSCGDEKTGDYGEFVRS